MRRRWPEHGHEMQYGSVGVLGGKTRRRGADHVLFKYSQSVSICLRAGRFAKAGEVTHYYARARMLADTSPWKCILQRKSVGGWILGHWRNCRLLEKERLA